MAVDILHWNVNGLKCKTNKNYKSKTNQICAILEKNTTFILSLQETHISNSKDLPNFIKLYNHIFDFAYSFSTANDPYAGIILAIRKSDEITTTTTLETGRLLYSQIRNIASGKKLNIFSIYCNPSNSSKQKATIDKLKNYILDNNLEDNIIMGDFNFVTNILDRNNNSLNTIDKDTSKYWSEVEQSCEINDSFRVTNACRRIYSFTARGNKSVKSRIDRIYTSCSLNGRIISTRYDPNNTSDHKILTVRFAAATDKGPGMWIFNNLLLKDLAYITSVKALISESLEDQNIYQDVKYCWDLLKQKLVSFTQEFSKTKALNDKKDFYETKKELDRLESLHRQKLTPQNLSKIEQLTERIESFNSAKIRGALLRSKIPDFEHNEPKISFLKTLEKIKGEENTIFSLYCQHTKKLLTETNDIKNHINQFYSKLYEQEYEDPLEQEYFLNSLDKKLSEQEKLCLDRPLNEIELKNALFSLNDNKSPGYDGLTKEFYVHFWEDLKNLFVKCVEQIKTSRELTEMQKRGAIKINFKKGDRNQLKNFRPLTLLTTDLKIITKALALRLKNIIGKLIHQNQTCIPGRHIENNIHITQNLIDYINETDKEAAFIFNDQEKAFDRMSHSFIFKTLKAFGFGENFIGWVKTICFDLKSFVKVNGYQTDEFDIRRGVRQGCPLSAMLYVLTAEALASSIRKNKQIVGFRYKRLNLSLLEQKILQYADDTILCVTTLQSILEIFRTLSKYESATNAKINKEKTEALWTGKWKNRTNKPLNLNWTNTCIKSLGIWVGNKVGASGSKELAKLNFAEQIEKIKNKVNYWKGKGLSLMGRVRVINIFVLSRLWHRTEHYNIPKEQLDIIENIIKHFIWGKKKSGRVRLEVLNLPYDKGGLQLVDINSKTATQRAKHIFYLLSLNKNDILRFLADSLIGNSSKFGQNGLSFGIITNLPRIKIIKNVFYKTSLEITNKLKLRLEPGCIQTINDEPLFHNQLFKGIDGNPFTLPSGINNVPLTVKQLRGHNIVEQNRAKRNMVENLKTSLGNITFSNNTENNILIQQDNTWKLVSDIQFKDIYIIIISNKNTALEWESRWSQKIDLEGLKWDAIWTRLFNKVHNYQIRSKMWEINHLNFWSAFRAGQPCKLCGEYENDHTHIINSCKTLLETIEFFRLGHNFNSKLKRTFGIENHAANFFLFHIRNVIFRERFQNFESIDQCKNILIHKIKNNIKHDLHRIYALGNNRDRPQDFLNIFMPNNIDIYNLAIFLEIS